MRLHLGDNRGALVGRDDQSLVNRGQCPAVEGNVQHRPADRGHPAINRLRLFHYVSIDLNPEFKSDWCGSVDPAVALAITEARAGAKPRL